MMLSQRNSGACLNYNLNDKLDCFATTFALHRLYLHNFGREGVRHSSPDYWYKLAARDCK